MLGPLKKAISNRKVKQLFLVLKDGVIELVHTRRVIQALSAQKTGIQQTIHKKSVQLRQSSLKQDLTGFSRNASTQTRLMLGLALRNATRSKYRTFLLIFGILITVALETGIIISVDTLYDDFVFHHRKHNFTDITVHPKEWITLEELRTLAKNVHQVPGVSVASPVFHISASSLLDIEIRGNVLIYGIDPRTHPDFPHLEVVEGDRKVSGYTIMISKSIQDSIDVEIGSPILIPASNFDSQLNDIEVIVGE